MALPEELLREVVDELGGGLGTGKVVDDEKSDSHGVGASLASGAGVANFIREHPARDEESMALRFE
jgi:hypothetical protein